MTMPARVRDYLNARRIPYQLVHHPYCETARDCADAAHIAPGRMAKAVLLKDDEGFLLAVVPADKRVDINTLNQRTHRLLTTASQAEVYQQFDDCADGAVPCIGQAYDLRVLWDDSIAQQPDCYLEAGDHEQFIYLMRKDFKALIQERDQGSICH